MAKKIKIEQLAEEVADIMKEYSETTSDGVKKAVRKAGRTVKSGIQAGAPARSGAYKSSWATKKMKESTNALVLTVYSRNKYQLAHLLEHGHAKRGGGRTRAIPHIAPAEAEGIRILEAEIKRSIRNG